MIARWALCAAALLLTACGAESVDEHPCPDAGTALTYENFGRRFFSEHCVRCHGAGNGYSSRAYTSVESIRGDRDRIFINAAGDNTSMPPGPDDPPADERRKLAEWLACGAP